MKLDEIVNTNASSRRKYTPIVCKDGFSFWGYAHYGAYCSPQSNTGAPYTRIECRPIGGQALGDDMARYLDPDWNIYAYARVDVVRKLIADHGGEA